MDLGNAVRRVEWAGREQGAGVGQGAKVGQGAGVGHGVEVEQVAARPARAVECAGPVRGPRRVGVAGRSAAVGRSGERRSSCSAPAGLGAAARDSASPARSARGGFSRGSASGGTASGGTASGGRASSDTGARGRSSEARARGAASWDDVRVVGAYTSGARARTVRSPRGTAAGPALLPARAAGTRACRPAPRQASTIGGPCVPVRRARLGRVGRPGGARRLAGEVRAGLADRVLATVAVALGSTTVVVVLGLLADLASAR